MRVRTDEQLMARYAEGDLQAFDELYSRYERRLYNYLCRVTGRRDTASELLQDTFLRLHRERKRYRAGSPFRPWIYTIATNLWRSEIRKRRTGEQALRREVADPAGSLPGVIDLAGDPEQQVLEARLLSDIRSAIEFLPDAQREVLLLSRYEHLSQMEIAQVLGVSVGAVKQRIFRGLSQLKEKLSYWTEDR